MALNQSQTLVSPIFRSSLVPSVPDSFQTCIGDKSATLGRGTLILGKNIYPLPLQVQVPGTFPSLGNPTGFPHRGPVGSSETTRCQHAPTMNGVKSMVTLTVRKPKICIIRTSSHNPYLKNKQTYYKMNNNIVTLQLHPLVWKITHKKKLRKSTKKSDFLGGPVFCSPSSSLAPTRSMAGRPNQGGSPNSLEGAEKRRSPSGLGSGFWPTWMGCQWWKRWGRRLWGGQLGTMKKINVVKCM